MDEALDTMVSRIAAFNKVTQRVPWRRRTGQLITEEFYTLGNPYNRLPNTQSRR